jgi:hypothetical protein
MKTKISSEPGNVHGVKFTIATDAIANTMQTTPTNHRPLSHANSPDIT